MIEIGHRLLGGRRDPPHPEHGDPPALNRGRRPRGGREDVGGQFRRRGTERGGTLPPDPSKGDDLREPVLNRCEVLRVAQNT